MSALDVDAGPGDEALVVTNDDDSFHTVEGWAHYVDQIGSDPDGPTGVPS